MEDIMIEKILKISPYLAGLLGAIMIYIKGYSDRKRDEKADMVDTYKEYNKIDKLKTKKDDVYKSDKW